MEEVEHVLFLECIGQLLHEQVGMVYLLSGLGAFSFFLGHLDVLIVELGHSETIGILVHTVLVPSIDTDFGSGGTAEVNKGKLFALLGHLVNEDDATQNEVLLLFGIVLWVLLGVSMVTKDDV